MRTRRWAHGRRAGDRNDHQADGHRPVDGSNDCTGRAGEITIDSKDVYSVQDSVLTIETTRTTPAGERSGSSFTRRANRSSKGQGPTCDRIVSALRFPCLLPGAAPSPADDALSTRRRHTRCTLARDLQLRPFPLFRRNPCMRSFATFRLVVVCVILLVAVACGATTPTEPAPVYELKTETFTGTVITGGTTAFPFTVVNPGQIQVAITALAPVSSLTMGIGLGFWDATASTCTQQLSTPSATLNVAFAADPSSAGEYLCRDLRHWQRPGVERLHADRQALLSLKLHTWPGELPGPGSVRPESQ